MRPHQITEPKEIDSLAIKVMAESGLDISGQKSKTMESLGDREFDFCDPPLRLRLPFLPLLPRPNQKNPRGL